ncbi:MAG: hypothetical protein LBC76_08140 [Treponema sp.]|jgi:hypothetical protein|nr:hypothetical protein [Treponema sp.]
MNGVERIAAERGRQKRVEGYTPKYDDDHTDGQLIKAAVCYALPKINGALKLEDDEFLIGVDRIWPWSESCWKPSPDNRIRELEKAGALIAAEIDRLLRMEGNNDTK